MTDAQQPGASFSGTDQLRPLLKRRKPVNHATVPFVLCWSQKAGCTAALKWYLYHAGLLQEALALHDPNHRLKIHSYENKVLKARPGYTDDIITSIQSGKPLLGFMRCPYERAFSSYMILNHWRYLGMQQRGVINPGMKVRQSVVESVHGKGADFSDAISFRDYLLWLARQDPATVNPHHAPQCLPLYRLVPVTFYRLSDFEAVINQLEIQFGLETSLSEREQFSSGHHRPKTETTQQQTLAFLANALPLEAYPVEKLPVVSREALAGTELHTLIRKIFAEDIATFDSISVQPETS